MPYINKLKMGKNKLINIKRSNSLKKYEIRKFKKNNLIFLLPIHKIKQIQYE